ncbi:MAG: hypothetical protein ACJ8AT_27065 [Hyalangium sp.]|uniref:hypothetical protein n=1 Tax=Hyalangium sp. TaxID=2028555 RepID=UPI00389AE25E
MKRLLAVVLLLGAPWAAGAEAPASSTADTKASAPKPKPHPFEWNVPGMVAHVDVAGTMEAQGIPMKLNAVDSTWMPPELFNHFLKQFTEAGFYLPPPKDQLIVHGAATLTAMDVERQLVYTVIMRVNRDGKTTKVLLGTSNMGLAKPPSDTAFAPVYPGAHDLITSNVEVGRTLGYVTRATPQELNAFYSKAMAQAGFKEERPGLYSKDRELIEVLAKPLPNGELSVLVVSRIGSAEEFIKNPHTD